MPLRNLRMTVAEKVKNNGCLRAAVLLYRKFRWNPLYSKSKQACKDALEAAEKTTPFIHSAVFLICRHIASHEFLTSPFQTVKAFRCALLFLFPPLFFSFHPVGLAWCPLLFSVWAPHSLLMQRVWCFDCSKSMWKPYLIGRSHGI